LLCAKLALANLTFYHFGDPQIGFGLEGVAQDVARFAAAAKIATGQVVIAGDLVNTFNNATQLAGFHNVWPARFVEQPGLVPGNHDCNADGVSADQTLKMLAHYRSLFGNDYSLRRPPSATDRVCWVGIHTNTLIGNATELLIEADKQWSWLETTLQNCVNDTTFIYMHHIPFLETENEAESYWTWPLKPRARFLKLVRQYHVKHLLCGHTHTTTTVTAADNAFTAYTVGGTARVFDNNGFGYRVFHVNNGQVTQSYVKLPAALQSSEPCRNVHAGDEAPHAYLCH
jgi:3',5'-cyclic AMP phosphodiesterase CpdA